MMLKRILILILSFGVLSCASTPQVEEDDAPGQTLWPSPPEVPRFQYLFSIYTSDDFVAKTDEEKMRELLVGKRKPTFIFRRPIDLTVSHGRVYLIDSERPIVNVFDLARRRLFAFGYRLEGRLLQPVSIAHDSQGNIYVADRKRKSIIVYDNFGLFIRDIDVSNLATQVAGITVDAKAGRLYVVDRGGIDSDVHQLLIYTLEGLPVGQIGKRGAGPLDFNLPLDVAVDSKGNQYVLDTGNFRVQKISPGGEFLRQWGEAGQLLGHFGMPRSINVDQEDNIYISDAQFGNVQIFNTEGKLLMHIGNLSQQDRPGNFSLITGVNLDDRGHLYILDQFLKKMEIYKKLSPDEQQKIMRQQQQNSQ